jgi:hypothetical protein
LYTFFVGNGGINNVGSGPKGDNFFLKSFYLLILLGLSINKGMEVVNLPNQLLELLVGCPTIAIAASGVIHLLLEIVLRGIVSKFRHHKEFCV